MTTIKPGAATKACPRCAEEIKAEARVCRYCHAQFVVEHHGYCAHCHAVVTLAEGNQSCPVCSGPLVDILTDSRLVETTPPPAAVQQAPLAPPPPATHAAAPPAPPAAAAPPVAPQPPTTAATPVGSLRKAVVPSMRQWIGYQVVTLAIVGLVAMPFASAAFENLRINMEEGNGIIRQAHALGPAYFVIGLVMALLLPWRALPKTVGGSRLKARATVVPFLRRVRTEFHTRALYRSSGYVARLVIVAGLWVAAIALFATTSAPPAGWVVGTGTPVTWIILGVGIVSSLLALPLSRPRHVMLDDEGNFFPAPDEAPRS